jgi:hypothetical protein
MAGDWVLEDVGLAEDVIVAVIEYDADTVRVADNVLNTEGITVVLAVTGMELVTLGVAHTLGDAVMVAKGLEVAAAV